MLAVAIGDTHFRVDNIPMIDLFISKINENLRDIKPDLIILLGDILHDHERLHTRALNKAYELINILRKTAPLYILVGNHDMCNNQQFLTDQHWMNGLKEWENVTIVDKVCQLIMLDNNFLFCPYVYPGRFIEALETLNSEWKEADLIFAHQEFKGCRMGSIVSEEGDSWDCQNPIVVSGHIHSKQSPQDNILYPGSSMQVAFGESETNIILLIHIDEEIEFEEVDLEMPRKRIIYITSEEFDSFTLPKNDDDIKLTIKGNYEDFKALKKTKKYRQFCADGIKIVYRHSKINKINKVQNDVGDFFKILHSLIKSENNTHLSDAYEKIKTIE